MINPPDELLADLQSALPPEMENSSKHPPVANGGGYIHYDRIEDDMVHTYEWAPDEGGIGGYEMPKRSISPEVRGSGWREGVCFAYDCVKQTDGC